MGPLPESLAPRSPPQQRRRPLAVSDLVATSIWMGGFHFTAFLLLLVLFNLPKLWAVTLLAGLVTLVVIPIFPGNPVAVALCRFICSRAIHHFPISLVVEDREALESSTPCVLGIEPHSLLPIGIVALGEHASARPLPNLQCAATSAVFWIPFVRHLWSWLGLVPASKGVLKGLLSRGNSIGLIPGGVQECLYMEHGIETIYLKQRKGFIRLAVEERASLVPVFIFGQSFAYNWWRPRGKLYQTVARRIGFAPIAFWGLWGTFIPQPTPMTIVIGKPIKTESGDSQKTPPTEQTDLLHRKFISEMERIFLKYRKQAGYEHVMLRIL